MAQEKQKVICVGSMGKDIFFPLDPTVLPHYAEHSTDDVRSFSFFYGDKVHIEDRYNALGGCACNVSVGLARLGIAVSACGNIGDDAEGMWISHELQKERVNTKRV
ncbi:MAG: carbohydrate kinase family protein, partial [Desulfatitalea sp.]